MLHLQLGGGQNGQELNTVAPLLAHEKAGMRISLYFAENGVNSLQIVRNKGSTCTLSG